jgi:thiamine kinase-like enzyme
MQTDLVHLQRLRALDFWPGPAEFERLEGGITNHNFLVRSNGRRFVARLCVDLEILGIDRRNEVICQRAAHALGVAPEIVHHAGGVLVSAFLEGRTLVPDDLRAPSRVPRLARLLRRLHDGWPQLTGEMLYFSVAQTVRTYALTARSLGASLPNDLDDLLADCDRLARAIGPFVPVLCHNDLLAANFLDDGQDLWLVDWEYAGMGHPLFDLANLATNGGFSQDEEADLLRYYQGEDSVSPRDLMELRILRRISLLREVLWALIQTVASDIEFDYQDYADRHLNQYRELKS